MLFENTVLKKLFEPSDIAILVFFRIIFGTIVLWEVFRYFQHDWIYMYWVQPAFQFAYYGFEWLKPWPGDGMYFHFIAMGILSVCIMVGFKYRISTILFFFAFSYMFLLDQTRYLNHFYLISTLSLIMIFVPAHKALSFDSWRNKKLRTDFVPAWSLWLLRIQIGVVYFFGGIAKISEDWLNGKPLDQWLPASAGTFPILGEFFTEIWFVFFFAYGALFVDLLALPFLLWRRTRIYTFGILVVFHVLNSQLFSIGIFPWFMIFATLMFFDPSWPRILKKFKISKKPTEKITSLTKNQKIILSLFLIFIIFQFAMPLRHYAYPGNSNWTEEGRDFSWHMLLRDKQTTHILFIATDPNTGKVYEIDPYEYLNPIQAKQMSVRPDSIQQYAYYLEDLFRKEGIVDIEITVDVFSILNGREPQRLIDPNVNLVEQTITILPKPWIVPLK